MTPNPTEEQTSGERALWNDRFEIWWTPVLEAARTAEEGDPAVGETAAIGRIKGIAHAAWDARQPEIDRLRAALQRIAAKGCRDQTFLGSEIEYAENWNNETYFQDCGECPACIAREALDG